MKDDTGIKKKDSELEDEEKQKTHFFISLIHETKTPLTLIQNYLDKYIKKAGMDEDIIIIKQNIDYLVRTFSHYLDVEKINRGQVYYNHEQAADLSSLLSGILPLFREAAVKKDITIDADIQPGIHIRIDPNAVHTIINNLIDNAITYTSPGGQVSVQLYKYQGNIIIKIIDTGIGMTKEQQKSLFHSYYSRQVKQHIHGMGMGLYIVKHIIDEINGNIRVESKVNKGTKVSITINKERITSGITHIVSPELTEPLKGYEINGSLTDRKINPDKRNLFIIDDDKHMLLFMQSFFKDEYNIYFALNGKEALEKITAIPKPDIILSDIKMEEMDGHSFLLHILNEEEFADIPVIFITARATASEKLKGLSGGAVDYIFKPFNIEDVKAKIRSIIRNRRAYRKKIITQIQQLLSQSIESNTIPGGAHIQSFQEICRRKRLSMRETEVMICLKDGLLNKEISGKLNISISTVEYHLRNIYHKFNVHNRIELLNQLNTGHFY